MPLTPLAWLLPLALIVGGCGDDGGPAPPTPPARTGHALAFDEARGLTLLFGGWNGSAALGDFWSWDGTAWTAIAAAGPSARLDASVVFDAGRGRVVLYGGRAGPAHDAPTMDDTWEWDGTAWTRVATAGPGARAHQAMAYDRGRTVVTLFGGLDPVAGQDRNDLWEWDGQSWTERTVTAPSSAFAPRLAFEEGRDRIVLLTVRAADSQVLTYEWDGTTLAQGSAAGPRLLGTAATTLGAAGGVLVFGGYRGATAVNDTWTWSGTGWTQVTGAAAPPARGSHALAWDRTRGRAVLFGGETTAGPVSDTWEFDGVAWVQRGP